MTRKDYAVGLLQKSLEKMDEMEMTIEMQLGYIKALKFILSLIK